MLSWFTGNAACPTHNIKKNSSVWWFFFFLFSHFFIYPLLYSCLINTKPVGLNHKHLVGKAQKLIEDLSTGKFGRLKNSFLSFLEIKV